MSASFKIPDKLAAKLRSRDKKRVDDIKAKKNDTTETKNIDEISDLKSSIDKDINNIDLTNKNELDIQNIYSRLNKLQELFDNVKNQLSNYYIKQHQAYLQDIYKRLDKASELLKSDFNFDDVDNGLFCSRKTKELNTFVNKKTNFYFNVEIPFIENLENSEIIIDKIDLKDKDILVQNIESSTIHINSCISNIRLININNSIIKTGPISSSAFADNCKNSKFYLISQQLRIHNCESVDFFTLIVSRTIIEDSKNLTFGPYDYEYNELDVQLLYAKISRGDCDWRKIDDFNWINPFQPSPNYSLRM